MLAHVKGNHGHFSVYTAQWILFYLFSNYLYSAPLLAYMGFISRQVVRWLWQVWFSSPCTHNLHHNAREHLPVALSGARDFNQLSLERDIYVLFVHIVLTSYL